MMRCMAEKPDRDSQTEEATEKKIRDEIERGNVPVSREVSIFAFVAGAARRHGLLPARPAQLRSGPDRWQRLLDNANGWRLSTGYDAVALCGLIATAGGGLLVPAFIVFIVAGLRRLFRAKCAAHCFRAYPAGFFAAFRRWKAGTGMFSVRGATEFLKSVVKFIAIALVVTTMLQADRLQFVNAMFVDPNAMPDLINQMAMRFVAGITVATLLLVTVDVVWSRINWRKELRMSRQEVKDEAKQIEGDPLVKARMRSLALDRRRRNMIAAVSRATMVVANPTHYAIALRYVREEGGAPRRSRQGQGFIWRSEFARWPRKTISR